MIVCLGATAATAVFGAGFNLMEHHGRWRSLEDGARAFATVHPAWMLRQPQGQDAALRLFVEDLRNLAAPALPGPDAPGLSTA